jgi:predicted PolB exonuclease-like 3'-5' exonuclease
MPHCTESELYFSNSYIQNCQADLIDKRIKIVINNFLKGQKLKINLFYVSWKDGELDIPCLRDKISMDRIHHLSFLLMKDEGKKIIQVYSR